MNFLRPNRLGKAAVAILLLSTFLSAQTEAAALKVIRVDPDALQAFIIKHRQVVVLFTSPSESCPACLSADTTFEEAAQSAEKAPWRYVRVQSMNWDQVPDMGPEIKVRALPDHVVFVEGKETGRVTGRQPDANVLAAKIASLQNGISTEYSKPTAQETNALRLHARSELFRNLSAMCSKLHPDNSGANFAMLTAWETRNKESLENAARQFLRAMTGARASTASSVLDQETAEMKKWLQEDQKIIFDRNPSLEECTRILAAFAERAIP